MQELFAFSLTGSGQTHTLRVLQVMPKVIISPQSVRTLIKTLVDSNQSLKKRFLCHLWDEWVLHSPLNVPMIKY